MAVYRSLTEIHAADVAVVGSKAKALAALAAAGFRVPAALSIPAVMYDAYMAGTGLRDRVYFELGRKQFEDMRWEEIWDAALRIRSLFLGTPLPPELRAELSEALASVFGDAPVVVRSSAPGEDSSAASFAGLHESFVNVRGADSILKHIRLVWASLWSDAALLYRQELRLDVRLSRMAVLVQAMAVGTCSGVAFSRSPNRAGEAVVEAVHGLNAGLVDGTVEPDRWIVDRVSGALKSHAAAERRHAVLPGPSGIERRDLSAALAAAPPLNDAGVRAVYGLALSAEQAFGAPQDVEWTRVDGELTVLQSRPITTLAGDAESDKRAWYLSLSRSFENLKDLRRRIENELVPGMQADAAQMADIDLAAMTDSDLSAELARRQGVFDRWREAYWDDCIPFAHGVRLFGQYYNDRIQPRDPYEFMRLLGGTGMISVRRNRRLEGLADMIRRDPALRTALECGDAASHPAAFRQALQSFLSEYEDVAACADGTGGAFMAFLLQLADAPPRSPLEPPATDELKRAFFDAVPEAERPRAEEMLELARASHRWRDDDNVYLDAVEAQLRAVQAEAARRRGHATGAGVPAARDATGEDARERSAGAAPAAGTFVRNPAIRPRQLVGQPAGPGFASGTARVIEKQADLLGFRQGEVLVCDALNPTMTFVIPMAAGVVERRGGMLIHGAIIAREYGIPCVTGVPDAAELICNGAALTVDGYLGIVRVEGGGASPLPRVPEEED